MIRQAVFALTLGFSLALPAAAQDGASSPPARPLSEIPFSRLTPDATVPVTLEPGAAADDGGLWTMARAAGAIIRIDAKANTAGSPIAAGGGPCASLVVAFDSVWVPLCGDRAMARIDPKDPKVTATMKTAVADSDARLATAVGSVWVVTDRKGVVQRIDPATNAPVAEIYVAGGALAVAAGDDALWVTSGAAPGSAGASTGGAPAAGRLTRVNPHSTEVVEIVKVGPAPGRLAVGEGGVWTLNGDGSVTRVDPATNKVVATVVVGDFARGGEIAAGEGSVWIGAPGTPVVRIDPRTNRAVQRFAGEGGGAIVVAHGSLWVGIGTRTLRLDPRLVSAVRP